MKWFWPDFHLNNIIIFKSKSALMFETKAEMLRYNCTVLFNIKTIIFDLSFKALGVFSVIFQSNMLLFLFVFQQDVPNFKFNQSATSAFRKFDIIKSGEHQSWKCSGFNNPAVIFLEK